MTPMGSVLQVFSWRGDNGFVCVFPAGIDEGFFASALGYGNLGTCGW